jgi:hypothetical protein
VYLAYSIPFLLCQLGGVNSGGSGWYDPGYGSAYGHEPGYGSHSYAYPAHQGGRVVTTRVTYEEPVERQVHVTHEVHHVLHKKKRRKQLVAVVPAEPVAVVPAVAAPASFEGSYVAVSGTPGRGSVHVVESGKGQLSVNPQELCCS